MAYETQDIPVNLLDILPQDVRPIDQEVLEELKADLSVRPLLHPITVVTGEGGRFNVKAGRKRFFAGRDLGWPAIPCLVLSSDLTDIEIEEITISENLRRYNLPWW